MRVYHPTYDQLGVVGMEDSGATFFPIEISVTGTGDDNASGGGATGVDLGSFFDDD